MDCPSVWHAGDMQRRQEMKMYRKDVASASEPKWWLHRLHGVLEVGRDSPIEGSVASY